MSSMPALSCFAPYSAVLVGDIPGVWHAGPMSVGRQHLPTDSIGAFVLTLVGLAVGSAVQVEVASTGAVISNVTAATATVVLSLPAYASGNANNDLRIKVRKGSASPFYRPYETLATAYVGAQSIFVSQIPDE